jgi:hypothetical protein
MTVLALCGVTGCATESTGASDVTVLRVDSASDATTVSGLDPAADATTVPGLDPPPESASATSASEPSSDVSTSTTLAKTLAEARVLLVGDSTLLATASYDTVEAFAGYESVLEVASCRTLGVPSCGEGPPTNTVEVIQTAEGTFDVVVVMAGYDEWWTTFPSSFEAVVSSSRAKGASYILWLTFREGVGYIAPDGSEANEAFVRNNATLRERSASGDYDDVIIADWNTYSARGDDWLTRDGIHLTRTGAYGVADYISRHIAHLYNSPCPTRTPDDAGDICPNPDTLSELPDLDELYDL